MTSLGTLYVVGTPIGNLGDLSSRAVEVLKSVSLVACEDTRVTARLLSHYAISTRRVSYHQHNEERRAAELLEKLASGLNVALVSDAGTPGVSDPGCRLVALCREKRIPVRVIPGPSAAIAALAASGFPATPFCFLGFLPLRPAARRRVLADIARTSQTIVLFESARRIARLLDDLAAGLGERPAFVAREMTKLHEEHRWGTPAELADWAGSQTLKGELTLVIGPAAPAEPETLDDAALRARFAALTGAGLERRKAVKILARELGRPGRELYRRLLSLEDRGCG